MADEQKTQEAILPGDYVLATKYSDGDPGDQWAIGFYDGRWRDRHLVKDSKGQQFRTNGFRRVAKISAERGEWMLQHKQDIEIGDRSLWWWAGVEMSTEPAAEGGPESMPEHKEPMSREEAREIIRRRIEKNKHLLILNPAAGGNLDGQTAETLQLLLDSEERKTKALENIRSGYGKYGYFYAFDIAMVSLKPQKP